MIGPDLHRALVRLRVVSVVYGVAWIATPATFVALLIGRPAFTVLGVDQPGSASGHVGVLFLCAFCIVAWISPVFVWALGSARRAANGSGTPLALAALTFVLPYLPLGAFIANASDALVRVDARAGERIPWFLAWAGPLLIGPVATAAILVHDRHDAEPPATFLVLCTGLCAYAVTRILIARRIHRLCTHLLLRPAVDDIRASRTEPVAGA